jgi:hypothetical protein
MPFTTEQYPQEQQLMAIGVDERTLLKANAGYCALND